MRFILAAFLAGVLSTAVAAPAGAAVEEETIPAYECNVGIANRNAEGSRPCSAVVLRREVETGRMTLVFKFPDGFQLEVAGGYVAMGERQTTLTPDQITWGNPGQTVLHVDANTPTQRVVRGRCVVANFRGYDQIGAISCKLGGPIGRVGVYFKPPPPAKKP